MNIKKSDVYALGILVGLAALAIFSRAEPIDRWNLFRPQRFFQIVATLAAIQFLGEVMVRAFGRRAGIVLAGFFGGFVSSTSVFLTLPAKVKMSPENLGAFCAAAILACAAMLVEFGIIILTTAPGLAKRIAPSVVTAILISVLIAHWFNLSGIHPKAVKSVAEDPRPLNLVSVIKLAIGLSFVFSLISVADKTFDVRFATLVAFLSGLFELHAVTFTTADLFTHEHISRDVALTQLAFATSAAFMSKILILAFLEHGRFAAKVTSALVVIFACGLAVGCIH